MFYRTFDPVREYCSRHPDLTSARRAAISIASLRGSATIFCLMNSGPGLPELVGQVTVEKAGVGYAFQNEGRVS